MPGSVSLTPALREDHDSLFETCRTRTARESAVDAIVDALAQHRGRYEAVSGAKSIQWHFVAVIHNMEASRRFDCHLHNGDPLTARTKNVPAGRLKASMPPYTWEVSAADALEMKKLHQWQDWSVAGTLYRLEQYNGMGYRRHHPHVKSPYLWSFSHHYERGKYVADGTWSDTAVSKQCGAAVLLRRMAERGLISFADQPATAVDEPPLVVAYSAQRPTDTAVLQAAERLQRWLTGFPGIFLKPDGWPARLTSDAFKRVTGRFLPGDPRA